MDEDKNFTNIRKPKNHIKITLCSQKLKSIERVCSNIITDNNKKDLLIKGPVRIPTKTLKVTTRKSPCGNGTATFDNFEMRIHKRLIDLPANEKVLHHIMRMQIPKNINIKIEMKD